jgi:hypothetical protein
LNPTQNKKNKKGRTKRRTKREQKGDAALFGAQLERLCSQEIIGRHLPSLSARTSNCGKHDRGVVIARGVAFGEERWAGESPIASAWRHRSVLEADREAEK